MTKVNLSSMMVDKLLKLRDGSGDVLSRKAGQLESQLAALGESGWLPSGGKFKGTRVSKMHGRKVRPKYRNPKNRSETWAGRGALPRWLAGEIKKGKKREDFAIDNSAEKAKKRRAKKSRRKQKGTES